MFNFDENLRKAELQAQIDQATQMIWLLYEGLRQEGFTKSQALKITIEILTAQAKSNQE
jgi:hypothetical protein